MLHRIAALTAAALTLACLASATARADEVTDEIEAALQLYNEGRIAEAKIALEFATQLLAQKKAASLGDFLPAPMDGWTEVEGDDHNAAAMFGGGISATRSYSNGSETCTLIILGDAPMMQMLTMMFTNPSMVNASGARMQRIGTERAIITEDGEVQMLVNQYLVMGTGDCTEENKITHVGAVDAAGLKSF